MNRLFLLLLFSFFSFSFNEPSGIKKIQIDGLAQGTTYHITYYANDSVVYKRQVDSILDKIDSSLSLYKSYSLINRFNHSQNGVKGNLHFAKVVRKAIEIYHHTNGLFDITVEPLTTVWGFGPVKPLAIPDSNNIKNILPCVSSGLLYWEGRKLKKKKSCVRLDANGIAQGYSVDVLADFFERQGVKNYVIELGGEIRVKGHKHPGNEKMKIGIETPGHDPEFSLIEKVIWMDKGAITTSGNYRRYYESDGKKITHLLNPKTGYSLQNELVSVTVYAKDAITADGYDNALMAMGLKKAMAFVEKRKDMAAHFIYQKKDGTIADTMTKRFAVLLKP
jgi:FAD:protein FMN transferase